MVITIKKDDGEYIYSVDEIADEAKQNEARVIISKVGIFIRNKTIFKYPSSL